MSERERSGDFDGSPGFRETFRLDAKLEGPRGK